MFSSIFSSSVIHKNQIQLLYLCEVRRTIKLAVPPVRLSICFKIFLELLFIVVYGMLLLGS